MRLQASGERAPAASRRRAPPSRYSIGTPPASAAVAAEIRAARGRALEAPADVADEAAISEAVAACERAWGGLDIAVASAAVQLFGQRCRVDQLDLEVWNTTIGINLTGVFLTCKHAAAAMLRADGGAIVCIGSPTGIRGIAPGFDAYSASKAGVLGLVRVMAMDYAREGIRVNAVVPGFTDTALVSTITADPEAMSRINDGFRSGGRAGRRGRCAGRVAQLGRSRLRHRRDLRRGRRGARRLSFDRRVAADADEVAATGADIVAEVLRAKPSAALICATGRTPVGLYRELAARVRRGEIDLDQARIFQLDEYVGVGDDDPRSLYRWLERDLLEPASVARSESCACTGTPLTSPRCVRDTTRRSPPRGHRSRDPRAGAERPSRLQRTALGPDASTREVDVDAGEHREQCRLLA